MTKTNKKQKAGDQKPAFSKKNDFKKEAAFQIFKESITTAFLLYMFVVFHWFFMMDIWILRSQNTISLKMEY